MSFLEKADKDTSTYKAKPGLSVGVIREISRQKKEPKWMLEKRLQAYKLFQKKAMPNWGPDLSKLNLDEISLNKSEKEGINSASFISQDDDMKDFIHSHKMLIELEV